MKIVGRIGPYGREPVKGSDKAKKLQGAIPIEFMFDDMTKTLYVNAQDILIWLGDMSLKSKDMKEVRHDVLMLTEVVTNFTDILDGEGGYDA